MNQRELVLRLAKFSLECQRTDNIDFLKVLKMLVKKQKDKENDKKNIRNDNAYMVYAFSGDRLHVPSRRRLERRNSDRE